MQDAPGTAPLRDGPAAPTPSSTQTCRVNGRVPQALILSPARPPHSFQGQEGSTRLSRVLCPQWHSPAQLGATHLAGSLGVLLCLQGHSLL